MVMYTISEAARDTGISAYTLRYYEKLGLLPAPGRKNGHKRLYSAKDIAFIKFLKSLKDTGMPLEEVKEFVQDGCIWDSLEEDPDYKPAPTLTKRVDILEKHLKNMENKKRELEAIMEVTREKLQTYHTLLEEEAKK
ncbi:MULTISPECIES: MerR family transcriptional regulator [Bacillaceae]|uniref:MerR family transcriptional regulator n=1 Tax=unclassified Fictibacillus TaxID=2644029 RepID=UPI0020C849C5|nr:MerR family transcriptional regulator [Fictibacillus sp. B-59209]UZJ79869.1 MerR family transcriptional regulator [Fictibacillus sp. KU28468]